MEAALLGFGVFALDHAEVDAAPPPADLRDLALPADRAQVGGAEVAL